MEFDVRAPEELQAITSDAFTARSRALVLKDTAAILSKDLQNLRKGSYSLLLSSFGRQRDVLVALETSKSHIEQLGRIRAYSISVSDSTSSREAMRAFDALLDEWTHLSAQDSGGTPTSVLQELAAKGVEKGWESLLPVLTNDFKSSFAPLGWPAQLQDLSKLPKSALQQFKAGLVDLLRVQRAGRAKPASIMPARKILSLTANTANHTLPVEPIVALEALTDPVVLRLRYHFGGGRGTDRVDKPEWIFQYILRQFDSLRPFLARVVQQVLNSEGLGEYNVESEFFVYLLHPLLAKLRRLSPILRSNPHFLPHHAAECIRFDVKAEFIIPPEYEFSCTRVITDDPVTFEAWIAAEEQAAKHSFEKVLHRDKGWEVAENGTTHVAEAFVGLLEGITSRYSSLPSLRSRAAFVSRVQLPLAGDFLARLQELHEAHLRSISLIGGLVGAVGGVRQQAKNETKSTRSVEDDGILDLCRWANSAGFVADSLSWWEDSVFFVTLWEEMRAEAIALDTSRETSEERRAPDSLFGGIIEGYKALEGRLLGSIVEEVVTLVANQMRQYVQRRDWFYPVESITPAASVELGPALSSLSNIIDVLRANLSESSCSSVVGKIAARLDERVLTNVAFTHTFSDAGGAQLQIDVAELGRAIAGVRGAQWKFLPRSSDASYLLSLPTTSDSFAPSSGSSITLPFVFESIRTLDLQDSVEAKSEFLSKIGLKSLSWAEARRLVHRREETNRLY
ncbi:hypothetical protein M427DRAFT_142419 [Gonapodya prolifera JEL478]|uniref:RINT-1 family protein n=1 Tax=Gonapodya prolifera (strain JEL478) TaxID=1344416 RepID=A0A139AX82_GONPJ|nr:hypothetical protein M427DRAFT_142419 [Gonapodya prolifera JEL478]|eukprot:KXS21317.1 hypothetical protein M427DRAFT_142419 [Gonapodya prolifera JEL478]